MTARGAALGLAVLALAAAAPASGQTPRRAPDSDVERLQGVLAQEQRAEFLYLLASGSGRLRSSYSTPVAIHAQHEGAVKALRDAITARGAVPVAARSFNDYVDDLHTMEAASEQDLIELAQALERRDADDLARLGPQFRDPSLARLVAHLADDEARWKTLGSAVG